MARTGSDRHGMYIAGDEQSTEERIDVLETQVDDLRAINLSLSQQVEWLRECLNEFNRAAALSARMFTNAASGLTVPSDDE